MIDLSGPENRMIQLDVGSHAGTPAEDAATDVGVYGNCVSVSRRVRDDGTVLQLYRLDAKMTVHMIHVYQPNGRYYVITASETDTAAVYSKNLDAVSDPALEDSRMATVAEALARLGR